MDHPVCIWPIQTFSTDSHLPHTTFGVVHVDFCPILAHARASLPKKEGRRICRLRQQRGPWAAAPRRPPAVVVKPPVGLVGCLDGCLRRKEATVNWTTTTRRLLLRRSALRAACSSLPPSLLSPVQAKPICFPWGTSVHDVRRSLGFLPQCA